MPKGVVSYVGGKDFEDRKTGEPVTLYSFKLNGDETWYRTQSTNPEEFGVVKGANISFPLDSKGKPDLSKVTVIKGGDNAAPQRSPAPRASSTSKDDYWSTKEQRDIAKEKHYQEVDIPRMSYCGAQEVAVKVVELALAQGAIELGAKKAAKLDILLEAIDKVTLDLFTRRMNAPTLSEVKRDNNNTVNESDEDSEDAGEYSEDE